MIGMPGSDTIPVDLRAWPNGKHPITVEPVQNDHTPIQGACLGWSPSRCSARPPPSRRQASELGGVGHDDTARADFQRVRKRPHRFLTGRAAGRTGSRSYQRRERDYTTNRECYPGRGGLRSATASGPDRTTSKCDTGPESRSVARLDGRPSHSARRQPGRSGWTRGQDRRTTLPPTATVGLRPRRARRHGGHNGYVDQHGRGRSHRFRRRWADLRLRQRRSEGDLHAYADGAWHVRLPLQLPSLDEGDARGHTLTRRQRVFARLYV